MNLENAKVVARALNAYGKAARAEGSLSGKQIQWDMEEFAYALASSIPCTEEGLLRILGIVKTENGYEWE